jgi:hypothetical protein
VSLAKTDNSRTSADVQRPFASLPVVPGPADDARWPDDEELWDDRATAASTANYATVDCIQNLAKFEPALSVVRSIAEEMIRLHSK